MNTLIQQVGFQIAYGYADHNGAYTSRT